MLVDASHINISDMGTMGNTMGAGGRGQGNREKPQDVTPNMPEENVSEENTTEETEVNEMPAMPEEFSGNMEGFGREFPSGDFSKMQRPGNSADGSSTEEMQEFEMQQFSGSTMQEMGMNSGMDDRMGNLVLFGVSVVILIIGLIIAFKFKGKNS